MSALVPTAASPTSLVSPTLYPFKSNYFDRGAGLRMHFLDEGNADAPPVLMVHGNPSWSFYYRNLVKALSPTRRYLADASYWIYLAHLPLLLGLQLLMRDWRLPWPVKFVLLLGTTILLLLLSYHWLGLRAEDGGLHLVLG